jgi:predicted SPOUT superfamily RNA methylase MTH1
MKNHLSDLIRSINDRGDSFFGMGVSAFMRLIPAFYLHNYRIIAYKDSTDLETIGRYCDVFSLQRDYPEEEALPEDSVDSAFLLRNPRVQQYINRSRGRIHLFVYQSTEEIEDIGRKFGWNIIGNPTTIRREFGHKGEFRRILKQLDLPLIPGEQISRDELIRRGYHSLCLSLGKDMVFQLPDITKGGGRGTFFIRSEKDYLDFLRCISKGSYRGYGVKSVNVAQLIEGFPASVAVCATRYGALISGIQTQVMDIPEVLKVRRGNGFFCGHDWTYRRYSTSLQERITKTAQTLSGYMWDRGYRGIFGIDLVVDERAGEVYPVECNTRYTGAFPMLSMHHSKNGAIPMDLFHILEFLDADYEIDVEKLNQTYRKRIGGSHIILFNKVHVPLKVGGNVRSGIYRHVPGEHRIEFIREGLRYEDLNGEDEFILTDGVPCQGNTVVFNDELTRVCRILFPFQIIESATELNGKAREIVNLVYDQFDFHPLRAGY